MRRLLSAIVFLAGLLTATYVTAQTCSVPIFTVPQSFFGITQNSSANPAASTAFPVGYYRLWDTTCVWPSIETSNGTFVWTTTCDPFLTMAANASAGVIFVMGRTPSWAIDTTAITKATVTAGGSGYGSPSCAISGAGSGATCTATVSGGTVTAITITAPGTGYASPTCAITGGGGSGATCTATLQTCTSSYGSGCSQAPKDLYTTNAIINGFVDALIAHVAATHPGMSLVIEGVNEADLLGEWNGYAGSQTQATRMADLKAYQAALYARVKTDNSAIKVGGPSGSSINTSNVHLWSDGNNLASVSGIASVIDFLNFHGYLQSCSTYCTTPDLLQTAWGQVTNLTKVGGLLAGKPVWITELNWGGTPPTNNANLTDQNKADYISRSVMYGFINNIQHFNWYAWDSHPDNLSSSGAFGTLCVGSPPTSCSANSAAVAYNTIQSVLVNSTYLSSPCFKDASGTWSCQLISSPASTGKALILFNPTTTEVVTVASTYTKIIHENGTQTAISSHQVTASGEVVTAIP